MGAFLFSMNHPQAAVAFYLEAIRRSGGRMGIFYLNLGQFYYVLKDYPDARLCLERVLADNPQNSQARHILEALPPS